MVLAYPLAARACFRKLALEESYFFIAYFRGSGLFPIPVAPVGGSPHSPAALGRLHPDDAGAAVGPGGVVGKLISEAPKHLIGFFEVVVEQMLIPLSFEG